MPEDRRKGADRRMTYTRTPYNYDSLTRLSQETGLSQADLINTFTAAGMLLVERYRSGEELMSFNPKTGAYIEELGMGVLLGDILASLRARQKD